MNLGPGDLTIVALLGLGVILGLVIFVIVVVTIRRDRQG